MNPASLRADAAGNRARIIQAARALIANADEVKLNAIARQAGVGQGTLYRHFPTREDLLAEVYREDVGNLVAAAPALLAEHEPLTALALWFDLVADYARVKRGVFAAVELAVSQDLAAHSLGPIGEALTTLLDAGKADGTIRPDVDARDVILLIGYLTRLEPAEWDTRARHLLQVVLDGLTSSQRLPVTPIDICPGPRPICHSDDGRT
jgi:AcrR family transcriptional regulator